MRTRVVIDGQQVEIPVLRIFRNVRTQEDKGTQERKNWAKHKVKGIRKNRYLMMKCYRERRKVAKPVNPHCREKSL